MFNSAEEVSSVYTAASTAVTAAGAGDNTVVTGEIIDRDAFNYPTQLLLVFQALCSLTAAKALFLKSVVVEHGNASDLSDVTTLATLEDGTGHSIASATGTNKVVKKYIQHLGPCKRYFRIKFTPDLTATATDTAQVSVSAIMFGTYKHPAA